jgi:8-oxo-dGTP diphosphatase
MQKIIVSAIITNKENQVLLAQRPLHKKIAPGVYHLPGGHVEFGETPEHAITREISEELNIKISPKEIIRTFSYVIDHDHTVGITFIVNMSDVPENLTFNKEDTESIAWVDKNDLSEYFKETDHDYITLMKFFKYE